MQGHVRTEATSGFRLSFETPGYCARQMPWPFRMGLVFDIGHRSLLTYTVPQRTREIGIHVTLGADRGQVIGGVLWQALVLMVAGIAIGLTLTLWASRPLQSFLYGVSKQDP